MADMVRLRLTIEMVYEANPDHYGTEEPDEMAKIDQEGASVDPLVFLSAIESLRLSVRVAPIDV